MNSDLLRIEALAVELSKTPFDPLVNFNLALEYQRLNQTASAVSFYLRTAEFGYSTHPEHVYTSLLRIASCIYDQNNRIHTVKNVLHQAIEYMPSRPEAWFKLAQFYEWSGDWQSCYTFAKVGRSLMGLTPVPLPADVGYNGDYMFDIEVAISAWWIGRADESRETFVKLLDNVKLPTDYAILCLANLERIGTGV